MFFGLFWGDWTILVLIPAMLLTFYAQSAVTSAYEKYSRVPTRHGLTGAQAARRLLDANGLHHVRIETVRGRMTDHYDPREEVIRLSEGVYNNPSVAAVGIACHEAGHAVQHATGYGALTLRNAIIPITRIGSAAAMPLFLIGLLAAWEPLMMIGILAYSLVALFQLITLPVEFNASRRAMAAIENWGYFSEDEQAGAKKVLSAAALTYVAALATSLLTLLCLLLIAGSGSRRD